MNKIKKNFSFLRPIKIANLKRFGRKADGGYVIEPKILKRSNYLLSFGLGADWSFELDCIKKNSKITVFIYDHTVNIWIYLIEVFKYFRRLMLLRVSFKNFLLRVKKLHNYINFINSPKVNFIKKKVTKNPKNFKEVDIDTTVSQIGKNNNFILKCDIEGSEYELIDKILKYSNKIDMLIFEFHWINKNEKKFTSSIKKLVKNFNIVHMHGNNHCLETIGGLPVIIEITLINKKLIKKRGKFVSKFPIKNLDFPNNPSKKDISFHF